MSKKLHVGSLSYTATEQQLNDLFAQSGNVLSVKVITDRDTGRSAGFAFIEMADDTEAKSAIDSLDGTQLCGRAIRVSEAKPRPDKKPHGNSRYFRPEAESKVKEDIASRWRW